ncbi:MAG: zinc-binding alcohol dehydrogenase family protein [Rhodopirellula sp.]|nr:zinc-binding alcohol dehydrogenase family protein [Rhodopirellula sp.]
MRAVLTEDSGGLPNTRLIDVEVPSAGEDDVLVEIYAAALNPADRYLIDGKYPGGPLPPFICGRDAAGVVIQSDAAGSFPVGSSVLVVQSTVRDLARGTLCEQQRFTASTVAPIPDGWTWIEAAAAPLAFQTAWKALTNHGPVTSNNIVAVTGAGGGVGLAAVQLALGLGAEVVALSRSPRKQLRLREMGVRHVFAPGEADLKRKVFHSIDRKGVDVVVDTVGGPLLTMAVHLLAPEGRVGVVGVLGGVESALPIPSLMFKRASIHGIQVADLDAPAAVAQWNTIIEVLQRSNQRPIVDSTFSLDDFATAFARLAESPFGKVVVQMQE